MAKNTTDLTNIDTKVLLKDLSEAQSLKRKLAFELQSGKNTAHKDYRKQKLTVAQIKTELAKRK